MKKTRLEHHRVSHDFDRECYPIGTAMEVLSEEESREVISRMKSPFTKYHDQRPGSPNNSQKVLLLDGPGQAYRLDQGHNIPQPQQDEILIRVLAIGLNPIDWKGPEYNFGLPSFPWINGRDFAGVVVKASRVSRRVHVGDVVLSPSTDYRDIRKAAFQEFVVSTEHNAARIPSSVSLETGAAIGVAFVAASLALGICLGVDFSAASVRGPNLLVQLRTIQPKEFPDDIRTECLDGIVASERAKVGDWIAVWGGTYSSRNSNELADIISINRNRSGRYTISKAGRSAYDRNSRRGQAWRETS